MKKLFATLILSALMIVGAASIPSDNFIENNEESSVPGVNVEQGQPYNKGFLDQITGFLSFSGVDDVYQPGETVDAELTATTEKTYDSADITKVVKLYKCADNTCETPPPIDDPTDDSCGKEEYWPEYDDCIVRKTDQVPFSITKEPGSTWVWDVSIDGLEDESTYILQGYFYDDSSGWEVVTDISEEKFTVESSDDDSSSESPNIETYKATDVNVRGDRIESTSYIKNTGGDMDEEWLVEMQPVLVEETGFFDTLLSTVSTRQMTCDPDNPENVHKTFQLQSGESATVQLESPELEGGNYDVKMVSATGCANKDSSVESTGPFGWSSVVANVDISPDVPEIVEYREPTLEVDNSTGRVTGTVYFENRGDADMPTEFIVEMQIRDRQGQLLSFVGEQAACDPSSPENQHKPFKLGVGERESISITSEVPEDGVYDVRFVTATECMNDGEGFFVEPYKGSDKAGFDDVAVTSESSDDGGGSGLPLNTVLLVVGGLIVAAGGVIFIRG